MILIAIGIAHRSTLTTELADMRSHLAHLDVQSIKTEAPEELDEGEERDFFEGTTEDETNDEKDKYTPRRHRKQHVTPALKDDKLRPAIKYLQVRTSSHVCVVMIKSFSRAAFATIFFCFAKQSPPRSYSTTTLRSRKKT